MCMLMANIKILQVRAIGSKEYDPDLCIAEENYSDYKYKNI